MAFVIDTVSCIGCHACSTACKSEHQVPLGVHRTWVKSVEVGRYPDVRRVFQVTRCNHCSNPPCVRICPTAAMHQRDDGIVDFAGDACIGCKACIQACPYDAIHIDPESHTAAKCNFCAHRVDIGLEPACVVVCPEHAILAGDLSDPDSEVSRALGKHAVTVRKPEQGTAPKLFYVQAHDAAVHPTARRSDSGFAFSDAAHHRVPGLPDTSGGRGPQPQGAPVGGPILIGGREAGAIRVAWNAQHEVHWHWPIPAYLVTKGAAAGMWGILAVAALIPGLGFPPAAGALGGILAFALTLATLGLLIYDLDRPDRFFYLMIRPQWRSWVARAAWILAGFSTLTAAWTGLEIAAWQGWFDPGDAVRAVLAVATLPFAVLAATYTAFLFAQAEGRDLWQAAHLPVVMATQAVLLGAATLLGLAALDGSADVGPFVRPVLGLAAATGLVVTLAGDLGVAPASEIARRTLRELVSGSFRTPYRLGLLLAYVAPLGLLALAHPLADLALLPVAAVGVFLWSYALVMAPQTVQNS
ncbi:MAG: 4Fe-4S dicluster domain-containing protein [Myxococcota bacterium]